MAEVWRARSRGAAGFEKTVVLKRVLPALMANPSFAELLVREAKIAALLSHPNIVQIFDLGEQQGAYFIAMEYVRGRDLAAVLAFRPDPQRRAQGERGLSLPLKLFIAGEVAKALDYAHRRRGDDGRPLSIVHRDVSPHNILIGYEGEVKVADFGIARADEQGLGRGEDPRVLRGKYAYMSPEQARGEPIDRRSDIFSFGVVLYEMLAGARLFRGRSSTETLRRVRAGDVPPVDAATLRIPEPVARVLAHTLAPTAVDRYPTAGHIYEDIARIARDLDPPLGQADLAQAMAQMFPEDEDLSPNKLRFDLMMRAYDDATAVGNGAVSLAPTPSIRPREEHTQALPRLAPHPFGATARRDAGFAAAGGEPRPLPEGSGREPRRAGASAGRRGGRHPARGGGLRPRSGCGACGAARRPRGPRASAAYLHAPLRAHRAAPRRAPHRRRTHLRRRDCGPRRRGTKAGRGAARGGRARGNPLRPGARG